MKDEVINYLKQDYLNNLDLIYALEHGAEIIHFSKDGIMLKYNDIYMLSIKDIHLATQLLNDLNDCQMITIHNDRYQELIKEKFGLTQEIVAYQYGYLKNDVTVIDVPKIQIKNIGIEYYDFIKQNYSTFIDEDYLLKRVQANVFIGAFDDDKIVGFAGIHEEGSIGFVEVIEAYRRKKIASMLETYMIDRLLKEKKVVYLQVDIDNLASMKMHEKLGYLRSSEIITWYN